MESALAPRSLPLIEKVCLPSNGLVFCEERYVTDGECAFHAHEETVLVFFLEGIAQDIRKKETVLRMPSTLIVVPAGEYHAGRVRKGLRLFEIWIEPLWVNRFLQVSSLVETPLVFHEGVPIEFARRLH